MKKIIIAIFGIAALPLVVFAQGSPYGIAVEQFGSPQGGVYINGNWMSAAAAQRYYTTPTQPYQSQPPFAQPRPANPAQAPRQNPPRTSKGPQITQTIEIKKENCVVTYEDPAKPVGAQVFETDPVTGERNPWYYTCTYNLIDENGKAWPQEIKVLSEVSIDAVIAAIDGVSPGLYFDPNGKGPGKALMTNDPKTFKPPVGSKPNPAAKPSGKSGVNPADKPAGKPGTVKPPVKPSPRPKPADDDDAPFTIEDIVPSTKPGTGPAVKPSPAPKKDEITPEMKADRARALQVLGEMEARLKALENPKP